MKFFRKLFFPFVPLYYVVTWVRNRLYDLGIKKSISFNFPVICVGNLSVGGTGKTPLIEYLIELLKNNYKIATLSRGYKRKSSGFQLANTNASADLLGDEPFQFYSKYKKNIQVAVDSDRVHGIKTLISLKNPPEIILLDDAFQHRKVKAGLNILLTTYSNIFTKDYLLPLGNLRESISGAKRAHIIIVTKCPSDLSESEKIKIIKDIKPKNYQAVFFSSIKYSVVVKSIETSRYIDDLSDFTLVTGIASAMPLVSYLKGKKLSFEHINYKDHHEFTEQDIANFNTKKLIITTEKDFMRLQVHKSLKGKLFYLPIQIGIDDSLKFDKLVSDYAALKR